MADQRPELSHQNKYHISKHRYYELLHFCMQYKEWKDYVNEAEVTMSVRSSSISTPGTSSQFKDSIPEEIAIKTERYRQYMHLVEEVCLVVEPSLAYYLFKGVTEKLTYSTLRTFYGCPACKDLYYECYRKFFWILDKKR